MSMQQTLPLPGVAPERTGGGYRRDHLLVAEMVRPGSRVLDVGCGDGELLQLLESRGIDGRGIELSREGVNRCVCSYPINRHGTIIAWAADKDRKGTR